MTTPQQAYDAVKSLLETCCKTNIGFQAIPHEVRAVAFEALNVLTALTPAALVDIDAGCDAIRVATQYPRKSRGVSFMGNRLSREQSAAAAVACAQAWGLAIARETHQSNTPPTTEEQS